MNEIRKELVLSEADRVPPEASAVAQGLTNIPQKTYSGYGDNFMPEESEQNNMPDSGAPQEAKKTAAENQKAAAPPAEADQSLPDADNEKENKDAKNAQKQDEEDERRKKEADLEIEKQAKIPISRESITNESLKRELNAIDDSRIISGTGMEAEDALREGLVRVNLMREEEGKTPKEKEKFEEEREIVRGRITEKFSKVKYIHETAMKATYRERGLYGERKLTEDEKLQIEKARKPEEIEELFNRMFDRVDTRPQAEFTAAFGSIGTFEHDEFVKTLNEAIAGFKKKGKEPIIRDKKKGDKEAPTGTKRAEELDLILQKFENEYAARSTIHNAYYGVLAGLNTEKVADFIGNFSTGYADLAFSKAGVTQAMHFYEQALLLVRESGGGYLKPTEVIGEMKGNTKGRVNEIAEELLKKANEDRSLKDKDGNSQHLEPWQIDRALAFARGMGIIVGRTIEIAASSILAPGKTAFSDQYAQRIIQELAPFRHGYKFYANSKFVGPLAYLMDRKKQPWTTKPTGLTRIFDTVVKGYDLIARGRRPWETKEIEEYANMKFEEQINVLNAMVPEGKERFFSILNPFEIGGIFTRTGWRIAGEGTTMINDMVKKKIEEQKVITLPKEKINEIRRKIEKENKKLSKDKIDGLVNEEIEKTKIKIAEDNSWIGTGMQIERKKGDLEKKKNKDPKEREKYEPAKRAIEEQLKNIAERTPLRLFLNIRSLQNKVLDVYFEKDGIDIATKNPEEVNKLRLEQMGKFEPILKKLVLLQERANQAKQPLDNFLSKASDPTSNATMELVAKIREVWGDGEDGKESQRFFKTLEEKNWKVPYTFGTDDVPYDQYSFESAGTVQIARRWGDMAKDANAAKLLNEFISEGIDKFSNQEEIVEAMYKIHAAIRSVSEPDAFKFTQKLAEGLIKFYGKDYKARIPFGIGTLMGIFIGKRSAAQIAYGRRAMAWDEIRINEFTGLLRARGMLESEETQHELQAKAGGSKVAVGLGYARTIIPLILLAASYYMLSKSFDEKD